MTDQDKMVADWHLALASAEEQLKQVKGARKRRPQGDDQPDPQVRSLKKIIKHYNRLIKANA